MSWNRADDRGSSAQKAEQAMRSNGNNVALIERFYANLWNQFDKSLIPILLAEDLEFRGSLGQAKLGRSPTSAKVDYSFSRTNRARAASCPSVRIMSRATRMNCGTSMRSSTGWSHCVPKSSKEICGHSISLTWP